MRAGGGGGGGGEERGGWGISALCILLVVQGVEVGMFAKDNSQAPVLSVCGVGSLCTEGYILLLGLHPLPLSRNFIYPAHFFGRGQEGSAHSKVACTPLATSGLGGPLYGFRWYLENQNRVSLRG